MSRNSASAPDSPLRSELPPPPEPWDWSTGQRLALGILLALLLIFLTLLALGRTARLSEPFVTATLPQRVDPNTASLSELSRLPHVGVATATKIIHYRAERLAATPDRPVFHSLDDLSLVPGIGPNLARQLGPYLQFPDDAL